MNYYPIQLFRLENLITNIRNMECRRSNLCDNLDADGFWN